MLLIYSLKSFIYMSDSIHSMLIISKGNTNSKPDKIEKDETDSRTGLTRKNIHGVHVYETPNKDLLLSATTILKYSKREKDKKGLEEWRKSVGDPVANHIMRTASTIGTKTHKLNELYVKGNLNNEILYKYPLLCRAHHTNMLPALERITNVKGLELMLYSDVLGIAGTSDVIGNFDDVLSIIDYKTKRSPQNDDRMYDNYTQGAMYATMYNEMYDIFPEQVVVISSNEKDGQLQIFQKPISDYIGIMKDRIVEAILNLPDPLRKLINENRKMKGKPPYKGVVQEKIKVW